MAGAVVQVDNGRMEGRPVENIEIAGAALFIGGGRDDRSAYERFAVD